MRRPSDPTIILSVSPSYRQRVPLPALALGVLAPISAVSVKRRDLDRRLEPARGANVERAFVRLVQDDLGWGVRSVGREVEGGIDGEGRCVQLEWTVGRCGIDDEGASLAVICGRNQVDVAIDVAIQREIIRTVYCLKESLKTYALLVRKTARVKSLPSAGLNRLAVTAMGALDVANSRDLVTL